MQNIESVALYLFVLFYIIYVVTTIIFLTRIIKSARRRALRTSQPTRESGHVNTTPETIFVTVIVAVSIYVMGRWIFEQVTYGCMHIGFWNPTCYDMNTFNRSWFAAFVIIGINAMMLALIHDTKRQNKRLR